MDQIFKLFKVILDAHIKTKTVNSQFHEKSQEFYEVAFNIYHELFEKMMDTEAIEPPSDPAKTMNDAYFALESIKEILNTMVKKKNTVGMDNLLRGLIDKVEFNCGNARAFLNDKD